MLHSGFEIKINGVRVEQWSDPASPPSYNHWRPLHEYDGDDPEAFFAQWEKQIPDLGCECKRGYAKIRETWQPDFSSREAFFASGVELHNLVNAKLGKPEMTLEDARKQWRRQDGDDQNG